MDSSTQTGDPAVTAPPRRGRGLDASRDVALRAAALELLAEIGYDRLTIDAIAARAHASKTTIYRRWPGKAELVVDALNDLKGPPAPDTDTGTLRGDLLAIASNSKSKGSQFNAQLMIGMITALARDAELRQVFRDRLIDPRTATLKEAFERAVVRGEIAEDRDLDLLVTLFPALTIHHLLIFGEVPESDFSERVINDLILPLATALTTSPSPSPTRR